MQVALNQAARQAGQVWPNPAVGAVLVARAQATEGDSANMHGQIIASAATAKGGRPHAELQVLEQAGARAAGATLYVTLEPCAHAGDTPSCAEAIIAAGISHVVIACVDPDPRTNGQGIERLRQAGVEVITDILTEQARWQHRGFFSRITRSRPWVTLKLATSMDGMVATGSGESQWITNEQSRNHGHLLRAEVDAILSTSRSIAKDDSRLTCRLPGLEHRSPIRVVVDRHLRLTEDSALLEDDAAPVWILTHDNLAYPYALPPYAQMLSLRSSINWLEEMLTLLGDRGLNRIMVETGGTFASALLGADLIDEIAWFRAPLIIGEEGISAIKGLNHDSLDQARGWKLQSTQSFGDNRLDTLVKDRY